MQSTSSASLKSEQTIPRTPFETNRQTPAVNTSKSAKERSLGETLTPKEPNQRARPEQQQQVSQPSTLQKDTNTTDFSFAETGDSKKQLRHASTLPIHSNFKGDGSFAKSNPPTKTSGQGQGHSGSGSGATTISAPSSSVFGPFFRPDLTSLLNNSTKNDANGPVALETSNNVEQDSGKKFKVTSDLQVEIEKLMKAAHVRDNGKPPFTFQPMKNFEPKGDIKSDKLVNAEKQIKRKNDENDGDDAATAEPTESSSSETKSQAALPSEDRHALPAGKDAAGKNAKVTALLGKSRIVSYPVRKFSPLQRRKHAVRHATTASTVLSPSCSGRMQANTRNIADDHYRYHHCDTEPISLGQVEGEDFVDYDDDIIIIYCYKMSSIIQTQLDNPTLIEIPLRKVQASCENYKTEIAPLLVQKSFAATQRKYALHVYTEKPQALAVLFDCCLMQDAHELTSIEDCWTLLNLAQQYGQRRALEVAIVSLCNIIDRNFTDVKPNNPVVPPHLVRTWWLYDTLAPSPYKTLLGLTLRRHWTPWIKFIAPPIGFIDSSILLRMCEADGLEDKLTVKTSARFLDFHDANYAPSRFTTRSTVQRSSVP